MGKAKKTMEENLNQLIVPVGREISTIIVNNVFGKISTRTPDGAIRVELNLGDKTQKDEVYHELVELWGERKAKRAITEVVKKATKRLFSKAKFEVFFLEKREERFVYAIKFYR